MAVPGASARWASKCQRLQDAEGVAAGVWQNGDRLSFGELNAVGNTRRLPAVILAYVCGYTSSSGRYRLTPADLAWAVELLSPAESAIHMDHQNLWSWREFAKRCGASSTFAALVLASPEDEPGDDTWVVALATAD